CQLPIPSRSASFYHRRFLDPLALPWLDIPALQARLVSRSRQGRPLPIPQLMLLQRAPATCPPTPLPPHG
ncbi:hypothetical protein GE21DRAFT_1208508, partial [Neurospora crassa]